MLGRVLAMERTLALFGESGSALICGNLIDRMTPGSVSIVLAVLGFMLTACWAVYHASGYGMAQTEQRPNPKTKTSDIKDNSDIDTEMATKRDASMEKDSHAGVEMENDDHLLVKRRVLHRQAAV